MKQLKFAPHLVPLVLSKQKTSTWRLWDDKDLSATEVIQLINNQTGKSFGRAKIIRVIEKPMSQLTDTDKIGHEQFSSDEEMYQTYSSYYQRQVTPETVVKILWFELLEK